MVLLILTPDEVLREGLELVGCDYRQQQRVGRATNLVHFKSFYGSNPVVYAEIWEDLQTTDNQEARIDADCCDVSSFLMAMNFLKLYGTEQARAVLFKICEQSARKWSWFFVKKVQALKNQKVHQISMHHCAQYLS